MSTRALHPIELKVLSVLKNGGWMGFDSLCSSSGLHPDQVRRSLEWLSSKHLVSVQQDVSARLVSSKSAPELALVRHLRDAGGRMPLEELGTRFASSQEFSAALGRARSSAWVSIEQEATGSVAKLNDQGVIGNLEKLLDQLSAGIPESSTPQEFLPLIPDLMKRGLVRRTEEKSTKVQITQDGLQAMPETEAEFIENLTPEIISGGGWKEKELRPIDVEAKAPRFYPGRRHPVQDFVREIREAYVSMGFAEIEGSAVHSTLWNFDALFVPQDHPGRDLQDTFYLRGMKDASLRRTGLVARVASTHEDGWSTGSRGWGYRWDVEEARRLVLRTHNTVLTIRALAAAKGETRVFALGKVYRNENLDYKHLAEFNQMDGIMVGDGLNVRHLMGFLSEFYKKLGMSRVRLWPSYFPYTEPSLQVMGYSEVAQDWIELGGSGVFRPEVTCPLGVKNPVLAWGLGIERLILLRLGLDDLRTLYDNDLGWLRRRAEIASSKNRPE